MSFLIEVLKEAEQRIISEKEVLNEVYFTELLKCSTDNEQQSLRRQSYRDKATSCLTSWLLNELRVFPNEV
jgi:hypothetical protein